jgi:hypothetical protein
MQIAYKIGSSAKILCWIQNYTAADPQSSQQHEIKLMQIGHHILKNNLVVAPMAGVTDRPSASCARRWALG